MAVNIKGNFYVAPKEKESSEGRVSRFKKWTNRYRLVPRLRKGRYRHKKLTRRQERDGALSREAYRAERERQKFYM